MRLEENHYDILEFILRNPRCNKDHIMAKFELSEWKTRQALSILKGHQVVISVRGDLSVPEHLRERLRAAFKGGGEDARDKSRDGTSNEDRRGNDKEGETEDSGTVTREETGTCEEDQETESETTTETGYEGNYNPGI